MTENSFESRLSDMVFLTHQQHLLTIPYKRFSPSEPKWVSSKCIEQFYFVIYFLNTVNGWSTHCQTFEWISFLLRYGGAFVDCSLSHPVEVEIIQLLFRINEVNIRADQTFISKTVYLQCVCFSFFLHLRALWSVHVAIIAFIYGIYVRRNQLLPILSVSTKKSNNR